MNARPDACIKTRRDGPVGVITLDRPDVLNALNAPLMEQVTAAVQDFTKSLDVRAIVLHGAGRAFSADLPWLRELEASFPYVETPDQLAAVRDVKLDHSFSVVRSGLDHPRVGDRVEREVASEPTYAGRVGLDGDHLAV